MACATVGTGEAGVQPPWGGRTTKPKAMDRRTQTGGGVAGACSVESGGGNLPLDWKTADSTPSMVLNAQLQQT